MDWKLKSHSWDFAQFQPIPTMDVLNGSDDSTTEGEFLVDLKLGQTANSSGCSGDGLSEFNSGSAPVKRARPRDCAGNVPVLCIVDGCESDLTSCREYHRRHKVCEKHSKTPEVTIAGHKKRFCQQCSRFHSLEEFDEEKRSCRKRLDGHNRRRRKPQPEPSLHSAASFVSRYRGMELPPFSTPPIYPTNILHHHKQSPVFGGSSGICSDRCSGGIPGGGVEHSSFLQSSNDGGSFPGTQQYMMDGFLDEGGSSDSSTRGAPSLLSLLLPPAPQIPPHSSSSLGNLSPFPNMEYNGSEGMFRVKASGDGSCVGKVPETIPFYYWE